MRPQGAATIPDSRPPFVVSFDGVDGDTGWVLVVDSDLSDGFATFRALERMGLRATVASDTTTALELLVSGGYALVLVDAAVVRADGSAFVATIKTDLRFARVPVLIASVVAGPAASAADGHVVKPVTPRALRAAVNRALEGQRPRTPPGFTSP